MNQRTEKNCFFFPSEITWKGPSIVYLISQRLGVDILVFIFSDYEHNKCSYKNSNDSEKYRQKVKITPDFSEITTVNVSRYNSRHLTACMCV